MFLSLLLGPNNQARKILPGISRIRESQGFSEPQVFTGIPKILGIPEFGKFPVKFLGIYPRYLPEPQVFTGIPEKFSEIFPFSGKLKTREKGKS